MRTAARVLGDAAWLCRIGGMARVEPVGGPLPHVADHVMKPVPVGGKGGHWRRSLIAVCGEILPGEATLPEVGHELSSWDELVAPGKLSAIATAPRGVLPFGFARQVFAGPARI